MIETKKQHQYPQIGSKSDRLWRIVVGNINTYPCDDGSMNVIKQDKLKNLIARESTDIVLISDHNKNIRILEERKKPENIMKRWWERTIVRTSHLHSTSTTPMEPGGTMIITNTRSSAHTIKAGEDKYLLGRWNYITLRGKRNRITTIVSIYRPRESQSTAQRQLVASISRRKDNVNADDPGKLWFRDLGELVSEKIQDGHEIIIAGDFNDNLNDENSSVVKFMQNLGLREIMMEKYGPGPVTYIRGTRTIDGIFATSGISITAGSYCKFHASPSDHRWLILDIDEKCLIKGPRTDQCPPVLRRATSKIPSVKKRFQELLENKVHQNNLAYKLNELYREVLQKKKMDSSMKQQYEQIEAQMRRIVQYADKRCRKLRCGKVPYSPMLRTLMGTIVVLQQIQLRMERIGKPNRPHKRLIYRLIQKYKYQGTTNFQNVPQLWQHLKRARRIYKQFKPQAYQERYNYLAKMAYEYSQNDNKSQKHHYKQLLHREKVKEKFRLIRYKEGRKGRQK